MTAAMHMHGAESLRHRGLPPQSRSRRDVTPLPAPRACNSRQQRPCYLRHHAETDDKTLVRSKMADGSPEERTGPKQITDLTFSAPDKEHGDTKKCSGETFNNDIMKLSFYRELETSESCEKSDTRGVDAVRAAERDSEKSAEARNENSDDRKKRCLDRYDSSESSDSGVAVLSPTDSGGTSCSDITEPRSPRSPESSCSNAEEGAGARMPPWASDPAPPAPRRIAVQPAPLRRTQQPIHRRITEFFNHKMKPQNGLKRESHVVNNDDIKRKCLPKNGVTHDLEKYISYLSQTLSPKVLMDVGKQDTTERKAPNSASNGAIESKETVDLNKITSKITAVHGVADVSRKSNEKNHSNMNGFVDIRNSTNKSFKDKKNDGLKNGQVEVKKRNQNTKTSLDPSAKAKRAKKPLIGAGKRKILIPSSNFVDLKITPATSETNHGPHQNGSIKGETRTATKMDSRMNGVTCGSNNLSLNPIKPVPVKKEPQKKSPQATKRTNRKSSACIANSKNLTWSKANNLKQVQLQKQKCINAPQTNVPMNNMPGEGNAAPKMPIPNGVRQMSMTMNGNLGNFNAPVSNFQNCHQLNIPQPCNGTVTSNNLASFVAVPQNVMLTTLRIPQNGLPAHPIAQQNNMTTFNRPNVNISSPTKLNGQFMFPLVQNINGTVLQIPNLMAKMPNFVLPQTQQLAPQTQDHLQNQQSAQILINGTLLKLANTMTSAYPNINKPSPVTSQSIPMVNKNVTGMPTVGMTLQSKPNYTVNLSHPVLVPQPGFIVTSVPNINVKETWSYTSTQSVHSSQSSCSNPVIHHPPPIISNFTTQALHTSSIPIPPVKPPDNPIQGADPPSSTVKEPELSEVINQKCDIPWLSKTVNNNIFPFETKPNLSIMNMRPFAQVSNLSDKSIDLLIGEKTEEGSVTDEKQDKSESADDLRKVEEVARREETIFSQITVLKDVSSNVHNSVIEANFCNATTESESGIGTDKSIDSPSDSQTSKECDEDSSLSLSVSVCSVDVPSQKSPILKQPKTLRFPPKIQTKSSNDKRKTSTETTPTVTVCLWENCMKEFESDPDLLDHLQSVHVESQAGKENYVCLWQQCKVRGKPSCSSLWLERHALSHGGNKPFKCIVDGCDRRFSTQILLERHVNNHFNETSPSNGGSKKSADSATKLIRRNGKKLRYRRQPWSARMFDFFDSGMMEGLAWRLARSTRWRLGGACPLREPPGRHTLTLHTTLAAMRYNSATGVREALVTYSPPHVLEDEWVPVRDVRRVKRVEISQLPVPTKVAIYEQFCESYKSTTPSGPQALNGLLPQLEAGNVTTVSKEEKKPEVSGAKKRKLGRCYGGNSFWPCGR